MLLTDQQIKLNPDKYIKFMCHDILISTDNQVFDLSFKERKEQLIGGSYCFYVNGRYRTKKWIRQNCVNVLGYICNN